MFAEQFHHFHGTQLEIVFPFQFELGFQLANGGKNLNPQTPWGDVIFSILCKIPLVPTKS